ncbi:MAG TPA: Hsp20/alpha crystallin family protein [Ktedonobacteraceae bacterium]|nr:Hsp20/alpha crystallin family protein [Ktedonobacteraceae bacterium]
MANITRYNPFDEIVSLRDAMDRLFEDSFIARSPFFGSRGVGSNLYETADSFVLQVPMPGVNPKDVELTVQENSVNLKWSANVNVPENATTHWSGFASSQYQQSFTLPSATNADKAEASYENGVLTLTLPKAESAKARRVKITSVK